MGRCRAVYIHIPFCKTICSYCDFCKMYYSTTMVAPYLEALEQEINKYYQGEKIKTIYIGGGTPSSLNIDELNKLFKIIDIFDKDNEYELTFECNPDITLDKIELLVKNGVNRISMGVQTSHDKYLQFLNRNHRKEQVQEVINNIKNSGINNINVDLMYAFPNQTLEELKEDLDFFLKLNVPHISTYSLMIEPHTLLGINNTQPIDEDLDYEMYHLIEETLEQQGFVHYEVSNYSKKGYESKHNLTYWNNLEYYGFGLGASGYIDNVRYENTRSLTKYKTGHYLLESHTLNCKETLENAFILGLRKLDGISIKEFNERYNLNVQDLVVVKQLLQEGKLKQVDDRIFIPKDKIYISNTILIDFIN